MAENANSDDETLGNSLSHEESQKSEPESTDGVDKKSDSPVTIDHDRETTDELHFRSTRADSVDAIVEHYKNNSSAGDVASDNDLIVAEKNCNDEANGGKHQFYCQEIPTQAQLEESTPLNSKLKYSGGQTGRSKDGISNLIYMLSHCCDLLRYILGLNDTDKKLKFKPRRIMCKHCISVDDFWLNNAVKSYNNKINKKYSVRF